MLRRFGIALLSLASVKPLYWEGNDSLPPPTTHDNSPTDVNDRALTLIRQFKERSGSPGVVVSVSISGSTVFNTSLGFADVEHLTPVTEHTVFRIASISKSITSLIIGRLVEQQKLSLDDDIREFVPSFPEKVMHGGYAKISVRNLMSHTSGIRSYKLDDNKEEPEFLLNERFERPIEALKLFQDDPLLHAPGEKYTYSTFAFTLLSAAIEDICLKSGPAFTSIRTETEAIDGTNNCKLPKWARIETQFQRLFISLGLERTKLDYSDELVAFRARPYIRKSKGILKNSPAVDNSYKWAGGGILSTSTDLIRMAKHLAFIYMGWIDKPEAVISRETLLRLWTPTQIETGDEWLPALGWFVRRRSGGPVDDPENVCPDRLYVAHTGGAVGATSVLLLSLPCCPAGQDHERTKEDRKSPDQLHSEDVPPICVVVLANLENASGIRDLGTALVELFIEYNADNIPPNFTADTLLKR